MVDASRGARRAPAAPVRALTRSPQWRGGGVVFGPVVRSHAFKLNKKVRVLALKSALSRACQENAVFVLDAFELPEPKTRQVTEFMDRFELAEMLLVAPRDETLEKSGSQPHRRDPRSLPRA